MDIGTAWTLLPGDTIRRVELHERYGGPRQSGISPSRVTPNVMIFSDGSSGHQHGYFDDWEGDTFLYTGEGQRGEQRMTGGNLAILNHAEKGRALRVFQGTGGTVRYVGEFGLDDPPWVERSAPETGGGPERKVIVFRLWPVGQIYRDGDAHRPVRGEPNYWAISANPNVYRVEDAVKERETDLWTVKRGDVRAGDRVALWKAKGSGAHRGVVALGEVLTDPIDLDDEPEALKYWRDGTGPGRQRRVRVRYVRPPKAPLWLENNETGALGTLSVARATGGGVYRIEPEQWTQLINALGGWPEEDHEEAAAEAAWEARIRARGQGFAASPAVRKAVEEYAMQLAEAHFGKEYEVKRKGKPYDLECTHRVSSAVLYVEVKGTTTAGEDVFLTPNEVRFARENANRIALFVQSGIIIGQSDDGQVIPSAGTTRIWQPWNVDAGVLTAVSYVYTLPEGA